MAYVHINDTWEKYQYARRCVWGNLGRLKILEIDYATEHSRRLLRGHKKSSPREALLLKQIRNLIMDCRKIESVHNRYSEHLLNEFEEAVYKEPYFSKTRELLEKYKANLEYAENNRQAKRKATRSVIKGIEASNTISGSNSKTVLENYIKHDAKVHKAIEESKNIVSELLKNAPKLENGNG